MLVLILPQTVFCHINSGERGTGVHGVCINLMSLQTKQRITFYSINIVEIERKKTFKENLAFLVKNLVFSCQCLLITQNEVLEKESLYRWCIICRSFYILSFFSSLLNHTLRCCCLKLMFHGAKHIF